MKNNLSLVAAFLGAVSFLPGLASPASADVHFGFVDSDDHHYYRSSGLSSFEVRYAGEIELSPDQERILSISPGGFLEIQTRRLFTPRKLRAASPAGGAPELRYWRADRRGSEQEARDFLERNLPEVARVTAVGARAEARRLLAAGGPRRVLAAMGGRDSEAAHEVFLEAILEGGPIDTATGTEMIRDAARQISGSSRLSRFLVRLAQKLPADAELTARLARACEEISSSTARREGLAGIADARGIPPSAAGDFARSASGISSSSEKASAVEHLCAVSNDPRVLSELAGTADTIDSSSERRRALSALARRPGVGGPVLVRILKAAEGINSSSEKASFLAEAAPVCRSEETIRAYLLAAATIDSSSETRRALVSLLRPDLPREDWIASVKAAARISSSNEKADFLVHAGAASSIDAPMLAAYLECAGSIDSSSEKRRSIVKLLHRPDLAASQVASIAAFAEREISSSSEREIVLREAAGRKP